mgnify:CR=1 FL=1
MKQQEKLSQYFKEHKLIKEEFHKVRAFQDCSDEFLRDGRQFLKSTGLFLVSFSALFIFPIFYIPLVIMSFYAEKAEDKRVAKEKEEQIDRLFRKK